jgi:hypothetical protein
MQSSFAPDLPSELFEAFRPGMDFAGHIQKRIRQQSQRVHRQKEQSQFHDDSPNLVKRIREQDEVHVKSR